MYFSKKYKNALTNRFSHAMIYEVRTENQKDADVAQVVAHLIGSEEVTGPSPVISFLTRLSERSGGLFDILKSKRKG